MMRNDVRTNTKLAGAAALVLVQLVAVACDRMPLMATPDSRVTVSSAALVLPTGGSTEVTAFVAEAGGTPVQNGTVVRFTTTLGRVDPVEAQTKNGMAATTFLAGDVAGEAEVKATSGGGVKTDSPNSVKISVGAAAIDSVTLRANPASVPYLGGTVDLTATVVAAGGRVLSGIPVSFASTEGQLGSSSAITDGAGEAKTSLTTNRQAVVTATAGTKTSNQVTIARREAPPVATVTLTAGVPPAATALGQLWTFTATVTVTGGEANEARPVSYEWDFGDDSSLTTNGNVVTHIYTTGNVRRTVTVEVTLSNNQTVSAVTEIIVAVLPP